MKVAADVPRPATQVTRSARLPGLHNKPIEDLAISGWLVLQLMKNPIDVFVRDPVVAGLNVTLRRVIHDGGSGGIRFGFDFDDGNGS